MRGILTKLDGNKLLVTLSKEIYEEDAVKAAAYKFTENYAVLIEPVSETEVGVIIEAQKADGAEDLDRVAKRFCNEVLDQQIRLDLEQRYGRIREIIVQQAFSPVKDLKKALGEL
jgi:His-Xaa-Ser system protein HxsD